MGRGTLLAIVPAMFVAGCGGSDAPPAATATVTVTATTTATITATPSPLLVPPSVDDLAGTVGPREALTDRLHLTVFEDGCGVIRSDGPPGAFVNLTWVFRDTDGFQVLGRVADHETRYRYFRPGTYTVVLEAFGDVPVSNTVTVHC